MVGFPIDVNAPSAVSLSWLERRSSSLPEEVSLILTFAALAAAKV